MNKEQFYTDPDHLAEGFLICEFIYEPPGEGLNLDQADCMLRYWRDQFFRWDGRRYVRVSDGELRILIKKHLHGLNDNACIYRHLEQSVRITGQTIANILLCVAGMEGVHIPETTELNSWHDGREKLGAVTFAFGNELFIYHPAVAETFPRSHTPKYFSLTLLPYDYDPQAACPRWCEFLDDVMDGDEQCVKLLQQWAGYLLHPDTSQHKFLLIAGDGQNGKTVFTTLLEKMVGEENVSHVPLSQFANRFSLAATLGNVLNSTSESSHRLDELAETTLKSYTSGDRMTFERKYKEPMHARPTAKIMISTNQLPQFADKSVGIWRRMLFVPFEKSYGEDVQNRNLANELCEELPGIFNWAFEGLKSLLAEGRFVTPARCRRAVGEYRRDVNPARAFLQDNFVEGFEFEGIACKDAYSAYNQWCFDNGYRPLNHNNFGKEVRRTLPGVKRVQKGGSLREWIYQGLAVTEGSELRRQSVSV
jgi:P4 family phage/plasmid primase-like protien